MKGVVAAIIICTTLLVGCSFKTKWRDTTSQGRSQDQAISDAKACYDEAGYPALNKDSSGDETQAAFAKLKVCMAAKGWELVRDKSN